MIDAYIDRAIKKASDSKCKYKVAAIGFDARGNFLAVTTNRPRFSRVGGSVHAEMRLMHKYANRLKTIFIFRLCRNDIKRMDPCDACTSKADELNINITTIE